MGDERKTGPVLVAVTQIHVIHIIQCIFLVGADINLLHETKNYQMYFQVKLQLLDSGELDFRY